jgi:predicted RNA-binding Zn ribbon-like protein
MLFGHDTEHALTVAVALVNAPPATAAELQDFVTTHDVSGIGRLDDKDLMAMRDLAATLRSVFESDDVADSADTVNSLLEASAATPRLTTHDGYPLHLHHFAPGAAVADHLGADVGMALAVVLAADEGSRLRLCEAGCGRVLVDLTRNRNRRYCDDKSCGNRLHVAAYRERRRTSS